MFRLTNHVFRNVFPHSTFNWVGIDGTQVLCHMTPVGMYEFVSLGMSSLSRNDL